MENKKGTPLWKALLFEQRFPYKYNIKFDKILNVLGFRSKIIYSNGLKIKVKRLTCEESFVTNIIVNKEYNPEKYMIEKNDTVIDIGGNVGDRKSAV